MLENPQKSLIFEILQSETFLDDFHTLWYDAYKMRLDPFLEEMFQTFSSSFVSDHLSTQEGQKFDFLFPA